MNNLLEYIQEKLGDREADIYFDVTDKLKGMTLEQMHNFCKLNDVEFYGRSGRWIMPFASINKKGEGLVHG